MNDDHVDKSEDTNLRTVLDRAVASGESYGISYQYRASGAPDYVEGRVSWPDNVARAGQVIEVQEQSVSPLESRRHSGLVVSARDTLDTPARYHVGLEQIRKITQLSTNQILWENLSPPKRVHELLREVNDRESFFTFVRAFIEDKMDHDDEWENEGVVNCLDAALRWAEATDMGTKNAMLKQPAGWPEELTWQVFAVFLYMMKVYE